MTPEDYCREKASSSGSSFYYSFLFVAKPKRRAVIALYAFCREIDDVVDECKDPSVAHAKLQWWYEEIMRMHKNKSTHPVTLELQYHCSHFSLPTEYFNELILGMQMDLEYTQYATFDLLYQYCYRVAGVVGLLTAQILGYKNPTTLEYAVNLGIAFQLTNILRDVAEDLTRGRLYIPMDELTQSSVTLTELSQKTYARNLVTLLRSQSERAEEYYKKAFTLLPDEDRYSQRIGIIMAEIYLTLLSKIKSKNYHILEKRITVPRYKKLWVSWKTARRELKKHNQIIRNNRADNIIC